MKHSRTLAALALGVAGLLMVASPSDAFAKKKSSRGKNRIKVDQYAGGGGNGGSFDLGTASIEGRIFKPAVFFVLARSDFKYTAIKFKNSFVDRIVTSAIRRPF